MDTDDENVIDEIKKQENNKELNAIFIEVRNLIKNICSSNENPLSQNNENIFEVLDETINNFNQKLKTESNYQLDNKMNIDSYKYNNSCNNEIDINEGIPDYFN